MEGWWIDAVILLLLLGSGGFLWLVESERIGARTPGDGDLLALADAPRHSRLYPQRLIRQAGFHAERSEYIYWSSKLLCGMLCLLLLLEPGRELLPFWAALAGGLAGSFVPELWLWSRRRNRRAQITNGLSFFIHLLVVYLRSGMTLAQAFLEASTTGLDRRNPLCDEIALLNREIEAGRDRDRAFELLAERTGVPDLKRLAAVITVGYRAGSPIAETLRSQAELLRARQQQMVTDLVNRRSMEAMLPMLLICFPVFVVLVLFPAAIQVFDVLGMIGELF